MMGYVRPHRVPSSFSSSSSSKPAAGKGRALLFPQQQLVAKNVFFSLGSLLLLLLSAPTATTAQELSPSAASSLGAPSGYLDDPNAWIEEMRRAADAVAGPRVRRAVSDLYAPSFNPLSFSPSSSSPDASSSSSMSGGEDNMKNMNDYDYAKDEAGDDAPSLLAAAELVDEAANGRQGGIFDIFRRDARSEGRPWSRLWGGGAAPVVSGNDLQERREPVVGTAVLGALELALATTSATAPAVSSAADEAQRAISNAAEQASDGDYSSSIPGGGGGGGGGGAGGGGFFAFPSILPTTANLARMAAEGGAGDGARVASGAVAVADAIQTTADNVMDAVLSPEQQRRFETIQRRAAAEAVQTALEWQLRAPVGRLDLSNYPAAVEAMNPVQDFLEALARVRRSQSGVSGLQALVSAEGPAAVDGDPADDVFVRSLLAEARTIADNTRGGSSMIPSSNVNGPAAGGGTEDEEGKNIKENGTLGAPSVAAMSSSSASASASASSTTAAAVGASSSLFPFRLSSPAADAMNGGAGRNAEYPADHGMSPEMIDALCASELVTGRNRINRADVDRAYARAARPANQMRVPVGCVRGCVLGSGFFESVVGRLKSLTK